MASRRARQRADSKPWQRQPLPEPAIEYAMAAGDADLALATGELRRLIPALIEGLGGEHDFAAAGPAPAPAVEAAVAEEAPPW